MLEWSIATFFILAAISLIVWWADKVTPDPVEAE
jgi:hypothetical protein